MAAPSIRPVSTLYAAVTSTRAATVQVIVPSGATDLMIGGAINSVIIVDDEHLLITAAPVVTAGTPSYATCTVTRGANGTTAATHLIGAPVSALVPANMPFVPLQSKATNDDGTIAKPWVQFFHSDWTLTGITAGLYGNDFAVAQFTVNDRGRITAAATVPIQIPASGVTAATYGDASHVGVFTVGADGRITSASSVSIALPATGVTAGTYGDSTHVAQITVQADGRVTAVTNISNALPNVGPGAGTYTTGAALTLTGNPGAISIDNQGRITGVVAAT
jgi:hypothetical protein